MDISNLSIEQLEALAYRLVVQRDALSNDLNLVQQRIELLKTREDPIQAIQVNPDTETTVDKDGVTHKKHGTTIDESTVQA